MPTIAPPALITGPVRTPLPYGLFSAVSFVEGAGRWENGVTWEGYDCAPLPPVIVTGCDPADLVGLPKDIKGHLAGGSTTAFTVYGTFTCSPAAFAAGDAADHARNVLLAKEEAAVGAQLWEALVADGKYSDLGTGTGPAEALGTLECYLRANYGNLGVVVSSCLAFALLAEHALLNFSGARVTDCYGSPVVIADGPGDARLGIVPAMVGYRSEVFASGDLFDQSQNDLVAIAERTYLFGWDDCGTASVLIGSGAP